MGLIIFLALFHAVIIVIFCIDDSKVIELIIVFQFLYSVLLVG